MLNPQFLLVSPDFDVVVRQNESSETIFKSGKRGDELMLFLIIQFPGPDFTVLMGCEHLPVAKGDGFDGTRRNLLDIKRVEKGVVYDLVDVDFIP